MDQGDVLMVPLTSSLESYQHLTLPMPMAALKLVSTAVRAVALNEYSDE